MQASKQKKEPTGSAAGKSPISAAAATTSAKKEPGPTKEELKYAEESDLEVIAEISGIIRSKRGGIRQKEVVPKVDWVDLRAQAVAINKNPIARAALMTLIEYVVGARTFSVNSPDRTPDDVRVAYGAVFTEAAGMTGKGQITSTMLTWQRWMAMNGRMFLTLAQTNQTGWAARVEIFPKQTRFPGFGSVMTDEVRILLGPIWVAVEVINARERLKGIKAADAVTKKNKVVNAMRVAAFSLKSDMYSNEVRRGLENLWYDEIPESMKDKNNWDQELKDLNELGQTFIAKASVADGVKVENLKEAMAGAKHMVL